MAKKVFKTIGKILLIFLGAIAVFVLGMFIFHRIMLSGEEKMLAEKGYLNRVSVGDYSLNVCSYGSESPKHTLVGLSGMGVNNYSAALRPVTDRFAAENKIVFVDRAGYGLSDDTSVPRTTERIVEDYRAALKNAGIAAPYVLLPHSLGGIYSTYWASKYPEEIEGVVYLDATETIDEEDPFEDREPDFLESVLAAFCKLGFQRPFLRFFDAEAFYETPDELRDINNALLMNKAFTFANLSEAKLINENCVFTFRNIKKTDIPKVYINSGDAVFTEEDIHEMVDMINERAEHSGGRKQGFPSDTKKFLEQIAECREFTIKFAELVGNCEIKYLNATHMLYVHKPDETAKIIGEFINKLDGKLLNGGETAS